MAIQQLLAAYGVAGAVVPGEADPYWDSVKLLASFEGVDGSTAFVSQGPQPVTLTAGGGAQIATAKHAAGALLLNGATSGSRVTTGLVSSLGTGPFTWEAFITPTAAQVGRVLSAQNATTPAAVLAMRVNADGSCTWILRNGSSGGTSVVSSAAALVKTDGSTEYHFVLERDDAGYVRMYIDGSVVAGPTLVTTNPDNGNPVFIGAFDNTQERFAGHIRWVRVTAAARYGAAFSPIAPPYLMQG